MGAGTRASSLRASSRNWVGSRPTRAGRRNPATRLTTGALRAHNPSIPSIRGDQSRVSCPGTAPALTHETRCARREIQTEDHHFSQQKHVRAAPMTPGDQRARPLGRRRRTHGERSEQSYREHTHGAENFLWPDLLMCGILTLERPCGPPVVLFSLFGRRGASALGFSRSRPVVRLPSPCARPRPRNSRARRARAVGRRRASRAPPTPDASFHGKRTVGHRIVVVGTVSVRRWRRTRLPSSSR